MLPPETTATIGPLPALPLSAAATDKAPAPSAITRVFSANNRIARLVSSKLTTIEPSATGRIRCHIRGKILLPPAPSTNDCFHSVKVCGDCFAKDNAPGAAVSGSAPQTFTSGFRVLIAFHIPVLKPLPPITVLSVQTSGAYY